jgi:hypothetical protein
MPLLPAEPCSGDPSGASNGVCLDAPTTNDTESNKHSQQQLLDLDQLPGLMKVEGGATLTLVNLHLNNVAYKSSYVPTAAQPYRVDGVGTGLWPSIQMGPGSKVGACYRDGLSAQHALCMCCKPVRI